MQSQSLPVYVFKSHAEAEEAVHALSKASFDVTKLSIVGKGYHTEEKLMGFYTKGDRIKAWGASGAFWGGVWGSCSHRPSSSFQASACWPLPGRSWQR